MTGGALLGLILISMGWLFFLAGTVLGSARLRLLAGIVGSVTVFFSIPPLARHGIELPWPWLWILLPLFIEPARLFFGTRMRGSKNGP
jgi:hypothetical protein